jgi:hypothetical protein
MLDSCGGQERTEQLVNPSPRSWARVSQVLRETRDERARSIAVNGLVGEAVAVQFFHTLEEIGQLPPISGLLMMPARQAARQVPATISVLYGLAYSLVAYVSELRHFELSIELLDAVIGIQDKLPRKEIQTLGMELLLAKAHRGNLFQAVAKSETYQRVYKCKAREIVDLGRAA